MPLPSVTVPSRKSREADSLPPRITAADWDLLFDDDFASYPAGKEVVPYGGLRRIGPWETRNLDYIWDCGHYDQQTQVWEIERSLDGGSRLRHSGENFAAFVVRHDGEWGDGYFEAFFAFERSKRILGSSFGANHGQPRGISGLVARYHTQRQHLFWGADPEGVPLLARREGEVSLPLWRGADPVAPGEWHRWGLFLDGRHLVAFLDGREMASARDPEPQGGTLGFRTDQPLRVAHASLRGPHPASGATPHAAGRPFPSPREEISLHRKGMWHTIRVDDVDGDGRMEILHVGLPVPPLASDWRPPVEALDLNGQMRWRHGEFPVADRCAEAARAHRFGGVGVALLERGTKQPCEIAISWQDRVDILDGRDGRLLRSETLPPYMALDGSTKPMSVESLSAVRPDPHGPIRLLAMNMECLYALDGDLRPIWFHVAGNLGHHPSAGDVDGDGLLEIIAGYQLLDSNGRPRWTVSGLQTLVNSDMVDAHNDMSVIGRFRPDDPPRIAMAASQNGFYLLGADGTVVARHLVGHAQQVVPGRFDPSREGVQFLVNTLWESAGIFAFIGGDGELLKTWEFGQFSAMFPLRWRDCEGDLALLTDLDRRPAIMNHYGKILWHAPSPRDASWRRLPVHGVTPFRTEGSDSFLVNYGARLVRYV